MNADGEAYPNGFAPASYDSNLRGGCPDDPNDNCVNELTVDNLLNKPKLGSTDEPLFSRAIDLIVGQQQPAKSVRHLDRFSRIDLQEVPLKKGMQDLRPHGHGMYVEPFMLPADEKQ